MEPSERDLGGGCKVEPVADYFAVRLGLAADRIHLLTVAGAEARPEGGLLTDEHGRNHGHESLSDEAVQGPANQRELQQHGGPLEVGEPGARYLRSPFYVDDVEGFADVNVFTLIEVEDRDLAPLLDLEVVVIAIPVWHRFMWWIGQSQPGLVEDRVEVIRQFDQAPVLAGKTRRLSDGDLLVVPGQGGDAFTGRLLLRSELLGPGSCCPSLGVEVGEGSKIDLDVTTSHRRGQAIGVVTQQRQVQHQVHGREPVTSPDGSLVRIVSP